MHNLCWNLVDSLLFAHIFGLKHNEMIALSLYLQDLDKRSVTNDKGHRKKKKNLCVM